MLGKECEAQIRRRTSRVVDLDLKDCLNYYLHTLDVQAFEEETNVCIPSEPREICTEMSPRNATSELLRTHSY